ncbi:DNA replication/repair protein RecF [Protaetiibacter mangrovi]|uniref:DNA replication and repair protein RecF n=1 Tax=Protaetiibacter mangrovi TaxID=2970926 RepID=A0ABT1ZHB9_9MICO|nr:DNA replication/repair protein RecF [Protaetiibacter mangrovi]MCS0500082.1 DNA replication/repair protein RecF [Protaetiibacter mangrovi]TPX02361.1 DNA replication/repair protein RecF [Schumannella luteola]
MFVSHLELADFRNYHSASLALAPGPNLIVGSNGQGKTNLVESINYLATLGSHRVSTDQALIRHGRDVAVVRARLEHGGRQLLVELQLNRTGANRAQLNRAAAKPRDLPRHVHAVLFAPEDLALVRGEPSGRRRFLDQLLVQLTPRMAGVLADYDRVLKQRNTLLKSARAARVGAAQLSTLDVWDERLIDLGSEIIEARGELVGGLRPFVGTAYAAIAGEVHEAELASELSILGAAPDEETEVSEQSVRSEIDRTEAVSAFTTALARNRRAELERGLTLAGPHRDDLLLRLNGLPARGYASHGESWSFALALRLASAALLRADSASGDPVLILDDVFAELDESRRLRLADAVAGYEQVLITAAVESDVPPALAAHTVRIRAGEVIDEAGGA